MTICEECKQSVSEKVEKYSKEHFHGRVLCIPCQNKVRAEEENKGTLDSFGSKEDEGLEEYNREVSAELEAESNELSEKIIALVTTMSVPDESKFHAWLESEFGVKRIDDLDLQDKRKVLEEVESYTKKVIEPEVVDNEEGWKTVEIDEGAFAFHEEDGKILCKSGDNIYELHVSVPDCTCPGFQMAKNKWCKHLKAAAQLYRVKELPGVPAEITKALAKQEKKRWKAKKEETVAIEVLGKRVDLVVQTPQEIIHNEEKAAEMIKAILGPNPKQEDVIEEYGNIKEIAADVIISLAQYAGIRFQPFIKETEVTKINLGKVFKAIPMSKDKKEQYEALADFMPDTDVTVRCRITSIAGWRDKKGDLHLGMGTKEEHLTPYKLKDIATRGANFVETMCETKSAKKSILGCLPITHDGLKSKIMDIYGWK